MKSGPGGSSASLYSYSPQSSPVTKTFEEAAAAASKDGRLARHTSADYERIRVVGKGSFGMAVLYRRRDDDSFVILKEINLHELNPSERQMSLNEVRLLSRLDHPHIIAFYDSFEEEGTLMIEMEYADGGTLAQFLGRQSELLAEAQAMDMFEQMVSAVSYLHDNSILHRDLKTANIFLTKELMVKIGDFGISKKMGTETKFQGAQTILGTPYYLSPEMCEGRSYNEKSDIWALGCCLYEMSALKKAFDADNLPTLIHKIINSEYEPLSPKGPYSQELRILIRDLLKTDPEQRPAAASVLEQVRRFRSLASAKDPLLGGPAPKGKPCPGGGGQFGQSPVDSYSALYGFDVFNVTLSAVQEFPARIQIQQFAVSPTHQLLLTADSRVYSWGDNRFGQLGHGDRKKRLVPTLVQALETKGVSRVAAGKHFSLFCAGRGIVMAAGHRQLVGTGTIGEDQTKPKIVDALLKEEIVDICCGDEHAAVLTESGGVFVWGRGANGRLGTGDCKDVFVPTQIQIPTRQLINSLVCGPDATMLITNSGTVLAMGSNKYNKLNLNQRSGFFKDVKGKEPQQQQQQQQQPHFGGPMEVEDVLLPSAIKPFPSRVVSASLGAEHSGVLLENGHVHMFGLNSCGQLGTGNILPCQSSYTRPVKALLSKACLHLICGDGFTAAATVDNELYFWGVRGGGGGGGEQQSGGGPTAENNAHLAEMPPAAATGAKVYQMTKTREGWQLSAPNPTHQAAVLQPTLVLRLDICRSPAGLNSLNSCARGLSAASKPFIGLAGLVCSAKRVFCVVDVAKEQLPKAKEETDTLIRDNQHMGEGKRRHRRRRSAPDALSVKSMDTWIKEELNSAEYIPYNQQQPMPIDRTQQQQQQQDSSSMLLQSERKLRAEIELLRGQLQEQKSTFRGHQKQMAQLQGKLADLQHLLRRNHGLLALPPVNIPPPAYPGVVEQKTTNAEKRPSVLRNTFLPSQQDGPPATRACTIL